MHQGSLPVPRQQLAEEIETKPDTSSHTTVYRRRRRYSSSDDDCAPMAKKQARTLCESPVAVSHNGDEGTSDLASIKRVMEEHNARMLEHMSQLSRRMGALEAAVIALIAQRISPQPQPQPQPQSSLLEELLVTPCSTVDELEDMDRSLAQPDRRTSMQHLLGSLGGANLGAAIRRMLRRVATNNVLAQYSLKGRRAKKPFQDLKLCTIITVACVKNFPGKTVSEVEECIGQTLKFAPHRRSAGGLEE